LLMRGELWLTSEPDSAGLRPLPPLSRPHSDQLSLELSQSAEYREHKPTMRACCVRPHIAKRLESRLPLCDRGQHIQEVPRRSSQAVQSRDHQNVTGVKHLHQTVELFPIGSRTADLLAKNLRASSCAQLGKLRLERLSLRAHSAVAVNGHLKLLLC